MRATLQCGQCVLSLVRLAGGLNPWNKSCLNECSGSNATAAQHVRVHVQSLVLDAAGGKNTTGTCLRA